MKRILTISLRKHQKYVHCIHFQKHTKEGLCMNLIKNNEFYLYVPYWFFFFEIIKLWRNDLKSEQADRIAINFSWKLNYGATNLWHNKFVLTYRNFNWHLTINTVLIVQIDEINLKPLQASLTTGPYVFWVTLNYSDFSIHPDPKLGSQLNFVPNAVFQCLHSHNLI